MENKLMVTEGYRIGSELELKEVIDDFISKHPDFIHDGMKKKDIVKIYRKRNKPYRHVVFFQIKENWFLQFLTDEEVLYRTLF
jgi:hypothetical protein